MSVEKAPHSVTSLNPFTKHHGAFIHLLYGLDELNVDPPENPTCDGDPAGWRLSMVAHVTLVEAFVRPGNMADGHVTRRLSPDVGAIFIESSWGV